MFDKINIESDELVIGLLAGACIIGMIWIFIFTLAEEASKPAAHPASYAVLHSSPYLPPIPSDQGCATHVSLSGPVPGHFAEVMK